MTDRFEEIKELYELGDWPSNPNEAFELSEWLIAEVERLRGIEDAALLWAHRRKVGCASDQFDITNRFVSVLDHNARPGDEDE